MGAKRRQPQTCSTSAFPADGDTLSIGLGQFCPAIRRKPQHAVNNREHGVMGHQGAVFRPTRTSASTAKKVEKQIQPRSTGAAGETLGASFVARSYRATSQPLVPLIQAGLSHQGFALIDVLSTCVHFQ